MGEDHFVAAHTLWNLQRLLGAICRVDDSHSTQRSKGVGPQGLCFDHSKRVDRILLDRSFSVVAPAKAKKEKEEKLAKGTPGTDGT